MNQIISGSGFLLVYWSHCGIYTHITSSARSELLFVSVPAVPERPEDLIITAVTKDSISVAWRPPKYDGGAEVTAYVLESRMIGRDNFTKVGGEDKLMDRKFTLTGLKDGSSHEFRVSAVNQVGQGKPSFATKPVQCKDELGE